jgi:hypothetical protein
LIYRWIVALYQRQKNLKTLYLKRVNENKKIEACGSQAGPTEEEIIDCKVTSIVRFLGNLRVFDV